MRTLVQLLSAFAVVAALGTHGHAQTPPASKVLFVNIHGDYDTDGVNAFNQLKAYAGAANATYFDLASNGALAAQLAANHYDQIWVYDLSYTRTDPYPLDWAAIAAWYQAHPTQHIICDGRFLSSFWNGRAGGEGRLLVENYYYNLAIRAGGLVLATDHYVFSVEGMDQLTAALGLDSFGGEFYGSFPLDTNHPLARTPNLLTSLSNDSSTGQAPFGLQPNGKVLHTFGYHSGNPVTPGVSSTIDGSLGVHVAIDGPTDGAVFCDDQTIALRSTPSNGEQPFTFAWSSSLAGPLGTTEDLDVALATLGVGTHVITVVVHDAQGRVDNDTITITVGGSSCEQACGAGTEVCLEDDGTLFTIGLVGPSGPAYAVCRVVPQGFGSNPAAARYLDCEDSDRDGVLDVFTPSQIAQRFGVGVCGN